jgi:hypothetical protein
MIVYHFLGHEIADLSSAGNKKNQKHFPAKIHRPTRTHSISFHHRLQESIPNATKNWVGVPCPDAQEHQTPTDNPVINSEHRINVDIDTTNQRSCLQWFSFLIPILFCVPIIIIIRTTAQPNTPRVTSNSYKRPILGNLPLI